MTVINPNPKDLTNGDVTPIPQVIGGTTPPPGNVGGDLFGDGGVTTEQSPPVDRDPRSSGPGEIMPPDSPPGTAPGTAPGSSPGSSPITDPLFGSGGADSVLDNMSPFVDQIPDVTADETVAGQLDKILNKASPLWDFAAGQGGAYANSRGLQNSDIGAQAGVQALYENAIPIASADAATYARRADIVANTWGSAGLAVAQGTIESILSVQDHMESMVEMVNQGDINSRLQWEQYGYNFNLSVQDNLEAMSQLAFQGDIDSQHMLEQFGWDSDLMELDQGYTLDRMNRELENSLNLDNNNHENWLEQNNQQHLNTLDEIAAQGEQNRDFRDEGWTLGLQEGYLNYANVRGREYSREIQEIYSTEGLTPSQQRNAARMARENYEEDMAMMQTFYTSNPHWDSSWVLPDLFAAPAGTGTGTGTGGGEEEEEGGGGTVNLDPRHVTRQEWIDSGGDPQEWQDAQEERGDAWE